MNLKVGHVPTGLLKMTLSGVITRLYTFLEKGNLLNAPDMYMEKIAIGSNLPEGLVDLDNGVEKNIKLLADAKNTSPNKLTACVLKRPRHDKIVESLN